MVTHICSKSTLWINRVRLPILLVVSWTGKQNESLCGRTFGSERHRYAMACPDELGADPLAVGGINN